MKLSAGFGAEKKPKLSIGVLWENGSALAVRRWSSPWYSRLSAPPVLNMASAFTLLIAAWIVATLVVTLSEFVWGFPLKHRVLIAFVASILIGILTVGLARYEFKANFELTHLVPDDKPMPKTACPVPDGALAVFLGNNVGISEFFPATILAMGKTLDDNPYPIIVINKRGDDLVLDVLKIFDENGDIITRLDQNDPIWKDSNLRSKRPNAHSLIVFDRHDDEVLNLYFLNPHALYLTGILRRPGIATVTVTNDGMSVGQSAPISNACVENYKIDFMIDTPAY